MTPSNTPDWEILRDTVIESFHLLEARKSLRRNIRSGHLTDFFLMKGLNWVNVLAVTEKKEVVMVRQWRHGIEAYTLELPGGAVEADENPQVAALRELQEETGFTAENLQLIGSLHANPAMMSMIQYTFVADNARHIKEQVLDGGESISVVTVPLDELFSKVRSGEISHALVAGPIARYYMSLQKQD